MQVHQLWDRLVALGATYQRQGPACTEHALSSAYLAARNAAPGGGWQARSKVLEQHERDIT